MQKKYWKIFEVTHRRRNISVLFFNVISNIVSGFSLFFFLISMLIGDADTNYPFALALLLSLLRELWLIA